MRVILPARQSYVFFVGILTVVAGLIVFMPDGSYLLPQGAWIKDSLIRMAIDGVFVVLSGVAGWFYWTSIGSSGLDGQPQKTRSKVATALLWGFFLGGIWILLDLIFSPLHYLGSVPHPPLLTALLGAFVVGGFFELLFRLVIIGAGMWLINRRDGNEEKNSKRAWFWLWTFLAALLSLFVWLPSRSRQFGLSSVFELPIPLVIHFVFYYGVLGMVAAKMLFKHGFWVAVGTHGTALLFWDVVWGQVWWRCLF